MVEYDLSGSNGHGKKGYDDDDYLLLTTTVSPCGGGWTEVKDFRGRDDWSGLAWDWLGCDINLDMEPDYYHTTFF